MDTFYRVARKRISNRLWGGCARPWPSSRSLALILRSKPAQIALDQRPRGGMTPRGRAHSLPQHPTSELRGLGFGAMRCSDDPDEHHDASPRIRPQPEVNAKVGEMSRERALYPPLGERMFAGTMSTHSLVTARLNRLARSQDGKSTAA